MDDAAVRRRKWDLRKDEFSAFAEMVRRHYAALCEIVERGDKDDPLTQIAFRALGGKKC